jgi:hypothetical protein
MTGIKVINTLLHKFNLSIYPFFLTEKDDDLLITNINDFLEENDRKDQINWNIFCQTCGHQTQKRAYE